MASTKLYKDNRSISVNDKYLDRYTQDGWMTRKTPDTVRETAQATPRPEQARKPIDLNESFNNYTNNQQRASQLRNQGLSYLQPPQEFEIDYDTLEQDPVYQAAMEGARRSTEIAAGDVAAANNRRGIMDSSITRQTSDRIAQDTYADVQRDVLPGLIESYYNRFVDQNNRNRQYAQDLFGAADTYQNQYQTGLENARSNSDLTNTFITPEIQQDLNTLLQLKTQGEVPGQSEQYYANLRQQADQIRNRLSAMGYDVSQLGTDVNRQTAMQAIPDIFRTGSAQQQDFENVVTSAELTGYWPDGTPTTEQEKVQLDNAWKFAESMGVVGPYLGELYGIDPNTPTWQAEQDIIANQQEQQRIGISQQNANTSSFSAQTSRMNTNQGQLMDIWRSSGFAPEGIPGVKAGTPYYDPVAARQGGEGGESTEVDAKTSTDNYSLLLSDLNQPNVTEAEARQLLQQNRNSLTDSDYRALSKYINDTWG